ncbi:unnamed protein product [Orchesella dallaii]|uniref:Uncharacterized protein n=1 Tax=Orchesella dallaii TaxID=48710 RepID=A0ABP1RHF0_9HEXA
MVLPLEVVFDGIKALTTPIIQPLFVPVLYYTLHALGTILSFWTKGDRIQDEADSMNPQTPMVYDFIIGPCEDGEWFELTWDHEVNMLSREGNCTPRLCTEKTDEGDADSYKKFSFYYEGKCLISGARNSEYCDDNLNVYFNH